MTTDKPESPCCARCRRGIRAYGILPCGYNRDCPCHRTLTIADLIAAPTEETE